MSSRTFDVERLRLKLTLMFGFKVWAKNCASSALLLITHLKPSPKLMCQPGPNWRRNWGIPKQKGHFEVSNQSDGTERWVISRRAEEAQFVAKTLNPSMSVSFSLSLSTSKVLLLIAL